MFKIGDWIRVNGTVQKIVAISHENDMVETTDDYVSIESIEPWKPKEGEWCWFRSVNGNSELGTLNRYYIANNGHIRYNYTLNGTNCDFNCSNCEPFIGKLPSYLKDKQ